MEKEKEKSIAEKIYESLSDFIGKNKEVATIVLSSVCGAAAGSLVGEAALGAFIGGVGGTAKVLIGIQADQEKAARNHED